MIIRLKFFFSIVMTMGFVCGSFLESKPNKKRRLIEAVRDNNVAVVRSHIERKVSINVKDERGDTPLMIAIENQHETLVKLLLEAGANPYIENSRHENSLQIALRHNNKNIKDMLSVFVRTAAPQRTMQKIVIPTAISLGIISLMTATTCIYLKNRRTRHLHEHAV